jgi:hypothetical protein
VNKYFPALTKSIDFFAKYTPALNKKLKFRASSRLLNSLHHKVFFEMRGLGLAFEEINKPEEVAIYASKVCDLCRQTMGEFLGLQEQELHCTLKAFLPQINSPEVVNTWARSSPYDERPINDSQSVENNTFWCSLLGRDDGRYTWRRPLRCFSCNDLELYQFECSRSDWARYYRSTLVYPLRYPKSVKLRNEFEMTGFLIFDSFKASAFTDLPDAFGCIISDEAWNRYHRDLLEKPTFLLGAIMADTLAMLLRPGYQKISRASND